MKNLTKKTFLEEVRAEIETIKARATTEEINRLNLTRFDPTNSGRCIYGQMTGTCFSDRAEEIMAKKYDDIGDGSGLESFSELKKRGVFTVAVEFTPLEVYITMKDAKPGNVIAYLKGETKTLEL